MSEVVLWHRLDLEWKLWSLIELLGINYFSLFLGKKALSQVASNKWNLKTEMFRNTAIHFHRSDF